MDIIGIGNAIVDVISNQDESFLREKSLVKGGMMLVDEDVADSLYAGLDHKTEVSGGSCANTMACAASLGADVTYIGKVRDDVLGSVFADDIRAAGVTFRTAPATSGPGTARSMIVVTPDGERTMSTYLGACVGLGPDDVDDTVAQAGVAYLEGYLWDSPGSLEAVRKIIDVAPAAGTKIALGLSDSACVERHLDQFREIVGSSADIVFANEAEFTMLAGASSFDEAVDWLPERDMIVAVTRSEKGAVVIRGGERYEIPAETVAEVVDVTGAGDSFAAGFLYGYARKYDLRACGRIGTLCAAEVISHIGPRPQADLADVCSPVLDG